MHGGGDREHRLQAGFRSIDHICRWAPMNPVRRLHPLVTRRVAGHVVDDANSSLPTAAAEPAAKSDAQGQDQKHPPSFSQFGSRSQPNEAHGSSLASQSALSRSSFDACCEWPANGGLKVVRAVLAAPANQVSLYSRMLPLASAGVTVSRRVGEILSGPRLDVRQKAGVAIHLRGPPGERPFSVLPLWAAARHLDHRVRPPPFLLIAWTCRQGVPGGSATRSSDRARCPRSGDAHRTDP